MTFVFYVNRKHCFIWRAKALLVPTLCKLGAPNSTRMSLNYSSDRGSQGSTVPDALRRRCPISTGHEPKLMEAFSRTKAPRSTSMCLDCSRHLGSPRPYRCRCCASYRHTRHEPMLVEASAPSKARWCRWCARHVPQAAQVPRSHRC